MKQTKIAQAIAVLTGLFCASGASASGFQLLEQNSSGLGNAFAGSAAIAENASTIFYNPAGMTMLQGHAVSLGVNLIQPSFQFSNEGSNVSTPLGPLGGTTGGDAGDLAAVPNAYFSMAAAKDLYFGLGVGSPFGLRTEYDPDWIGRFQSLKFDITTYNINPSVAWRMNDRVSLGFGLNWQRMNAVYERMAGTLNPALPSGFWPLLQNTKLRLDVNSEAWGWNTGALFTLSPSTKVGVSYRSAIKHKLSGTLTSTNQAISADVLARADIKLPDMAIVSVAQKLDDNWEMLGDISWTGWHKIQNVDIWRTSGSAIGQATPAQTLDADFRNTWRVALGANYKMNDTWKLKYGLAYDQSPVRSAQQRLVSLPDNNHVWFSLGAQWQMSKVATIDVGGAYLWIRSTPIDNDETSTAQGRVTGTYKGSVAILGAQYSQSF